MPAPKPPTRKQLAVAIERLAAIINVHSDNLDLLKSKLDALTPPTHV